MITSDVEMRTVLERVAQVLDLSEAQVLRTGLRALLQRSLREVEAEIFRITGQYGVTSVEEMEDRYRSGTLDEAESWRDAQALDHLEYQRDQLKALLDLLP
jgi:hypothetical protein